MSIKSVQAKIRKDKGKDLITLPPAQHCLECGTELKEFEAHVSPRICSIKCLNEMTADQFKIEGFQVA